MEMPPLSYKIVSNQGLENEISQLESQIQGEQPGSPEYKYDQLQLAAEKRELEIRQENPNLDPMTQDGEQALAQIMGQDPTLQAINAEIKSLVNAHPYECTHWDIPMDS